MGPTGHSYGAPSMPYAENKVEDGEEGEDTVTVVCTSSEKRLPSSTEQTVSYLTLTMNLT